MNLLRAFYDYVASSKPLDAIADAVQPAVRSAFDGLGPAGHPVRNALHGAFLGHPLHPVLTDIPIGAWSATVLLDAMDCDGGSRRTGVGRAADATLLLGLAGAVGSAVTGLADWSETDGRPRRAGVAHAILNVTATLLFGASWLARRGGNRSSGKGLALAGYLTAAAAGYIGGELVSHEQIGVDHSSGKEYPEDFVDALAESELNEGEMKRVDPGGKNAPILLVRKDGEIYALADTCAHLGGPLSEGKLDGRCVVCPWHASTFDLATGDVVRGPSAFPQPRMEVRVRAGKIQVKRAESGL
jgi:nitrite reductase/ring-hydroxylating ferredoxin subunit/uncharacterized membrane protein